MSVETLTQGQFVAIESIMDACDAIKVEWAQHRAHFTGGAEAIENAKQVGEAITLGLNDSIEDLVSAIDVAYGNAVPQGSVVACYTSCLGSALDYATLYMEKRKK